MGDESDSDQADELDGNQASDINIGIFSELFNSNQNVEPDEGDDSDQNDKLSSELEDQVDSAFDGGSTGELDRRENDECENRVDQPVFGKKRPCNYIINFEST